MDPAPPNLRMALEIVAGSDPIEGALSLHHDPTAEAKSWSFVGWVAFVRVLEEAIGAAELRIEADD